MLCGWHRTVAGHTCRAACIVHSLPLPCTASEAGGAVPQGRPLRRLLSPGSHRGAGTEGARARHCPQARHGCVSLSTCCWPLCCLHCGGRPCTVHTTFSPCTRTATLPANPSSPPAGLPASSSFRGRIHAARSLASSISAFVVSTALLLRDQVRFGIKGLRWADFLGRLRAG